MRHTKAQVVIAVELITGIWLTEKDLANMGISQNACPRSISSEETLLHMLINCEPFLELRKDILGTDTIVNINIMQMRVGRLICFAKAVGLTGHLKHELPLKGPGIMAEAEHQVKRNSIIYVLIFSYALCSIFIYI